MAAAATEHNEVQCIGNWMFWLGLNDPCENRQCQIERANAKLPIRKGQKTFSKDNCSDSLSFKKNNHNFF